MRLEPYTEKDPRFVPPIPKPIVILGARASGKSSVAKALDGLLDSYHTDLDKCYAENHGMTMTELYDMIPDTKFYQEQSNDLETCLSGRSNFVRIISPGGGIHRSVLNLQRIYMYSYSFYLKTDLMLLQRNHATDDRRKGHYAICKDGLDSIDNTYRFVNHVINVDPHHSPLDLAHIIKDLYDCYPK